MPKKVNKKKRGKKNNNRWIISIILFTILISGSVTLLSDALLRKVNLLVAFIILISIILIGIIFDAIGVAVTAASEVPFHSMASKKIAEGVIAVKLVRNADKVSNFCNDVIGDICGIVSGSVGILISQKLGKIFLGVNDTIMTASISAIIAGATIGGKALGKGVAMSKCNDIIYNVAKLIKATKKIIKKKDR